MKVVISRQILGHNPDEALRKRLETTETPQKGGNNKVTMESPWEGRNNRVITGEWKTQSHHRGGNHRDGNHRDTTKGWKLFSHHFYLDILYMKRHVQMRCLYLNRSYELDAVKLRNV